jgi:hypothetical protein
MYARLGTTTAASGRAPAAVATVINVARGTTTTTPPCRHEDPVRSRSVPCLTGLLRFGKIVWTGPRVWGSVLPLGTEAPAPGARCLSLVAAFCITLTASCPLQVRYL